MHEHLYQLGVQIKDVAAICVEGSVMDEEAKFMVKRTYANWALHKWNWIEEVIVNWDKPIQKLRKD
jgi:hypothetical protein